jgi:CO dehydrogenase/acetyl-CoA synthase beta subunit
MEIENRSRWSRLSVEDLADFARQVALACARIADERACVLAPKRGRACCATKHDAATAIRRAFRKPRKRK